MVTACFVFFWVPKTEPKKTSIDLNSSNVVRWVVLRVLSKAIPKNLLFLWKLASFCYDKVVDWSIYPFPVVKPKNGFNNVSTPPPRCAGTNLCRPKICITLHLPARRPKGVFNVRQIPKAVDPLSPQRKRDVTVYLQIRCVKEVIFFL